MGTEIKRKLASVQQIVEIKPITGADLIEAARIRGWWVVVKVNEFKVGDLVCYLEIDSFVPSSIAPFLTKDGHTPKTYKGITGERLKTVKLRKQLSQGLILPLPGTGYSEGDDLTEKLGIIKWEPEDNTCSTGDTKGRWPSFLRKTDQERAQNLGPIIKKEFEAGSLFERTVKLDGSSMTAFFKDGEYGVCSRNLQLKTQAPESKETKFSLFLKNTIKNLGMKIPRDIGGMISKIRSKMLQFGHIQEYKESTFVSVAKSYDLEDKLRSLGRNIAIQGELMGEGIQGNREGLKGHDFFVFDIFDIDAQEYMIPAERRALVEFLELKHCPVLDEAVPLISYDIDELLKAAEIKSLNNPVAEGIVYKRVDGKFSFKTISNKFLLNEK